MSGSIQPVLVRVINGQTLPRSILLDKIDRSSGQFETDITYAQQAKQQVYVPYSNPIDPTVAGYVDLYPTDEVLQQMKRPLPGQGPTAPLGTISGLADLTPPAVTFYTHAGSLIVTPVITAGVHNSPASHFTITGTTFLSLSPDVTYVIITTPTGSASQKIPSSAFTSISGTSIEIANATVTIGTPIAGWQVQVQANSKFSNVFVLT